MSKLILVLLFLTFCHFHALIAGRNLPVALSNNVNKKNFVKSRITTLHSHPPYSTTISKKEVNLNAINNKGLSNLTLRWITGLSLGLLATLIIAFDHRIFAAGFLLVTLTAQFEYISIIKMLGLDPPITLITIISILCSLAATFNALNDWHNLILPCGFFFAMLKFLIFRSVSSVSINEISTTILGMTYLGFLPSFWVKIRTLKGISRIPFDSRIHNLIPGIPIVNSKLWSPGSTLLWWTWTSIVFADVGAYFVGKSFGRNKLDVISTAAFSASPNKTVEGFIGGSLCCIILSIFTAFIMQWPCYIVSGSLYGIMLATVAFIGDLTASALKRDAKIKDSGKVLPGHGGALDRIDSYLFTAPMAYLFVTKILPLFSKFSKL